MVAPYEITANAENSDALDRLGISLIENRRYETVGCVERQKKQCKEERRGMGTWLCPDKKYWTQPSGRS